MELEPPVSPACHSIDDYTIVKAGIGSGTYSSVALARQGDHAYAIKVFNQNATDRSIQHECQVLQHINKQHPKACIVKAIRYNLHAVEHHNGCTLNCRIMVMEFCSGGDLFGYLEKGNKFTERFTRSIFQMFLDTLECVHNEGLFHGDLKLENTMVGSDGKIRIIDFGFADVTNVSEPNTKRQGTALYMAPEVKNGKYNGKEADLFALGIVLFVMASRRYPFNLSKTEQNNYVVLPQQYKYFLFKKEKYWSIIGKCFDESPHKKDFQDLVDKMLAQKPEERLSIEGIRQHPWYRFVEPLSDAEVRQEFASRKLAMAALQDINPQINQRPVGGNDRQVSFLEEYMSEEGGLNEKSIVELDTLEGSDVRIKDMAVRNTLAKLRYVCDSRNYKDLKFYDDNILLENDELKLTVEENIPEVNERLGQVVITRIRLEKDGDCEVDSIKIRVSKHIQSQTLVLDFKRGRRNTDGLWFRDLKQTILETLSKA